MTTPFTVPASESWLVPSGSDLPGLRVTLALPTGQVTTSTPVVLLLDGDFLFLTATEFARTVNLVTLGEFPSVAVVGVMRDEVDPMRYIASRFRDFTPDQWVLPGAFADDNVMASMGTGGASGLLSLLENSVLPQVDERLRASGTLMGEIAIAGWSLSGLFASWAWLQRPDVFSHLLAISPSLWWNHASLLGADVAPRPVSHKVFIGVGEHEEGDLAKVYPQRFANAAQREMAAMVRNAQVFADRVSGAGAAVESVAFTDEHHITVQGAAIARGLRHIFG
jgi:predicted alpha/beta superfamily hydrolase